MTARPAGRRAARRRRPPRRRRTAPPCRLPIGCRARARASRARRRVRRAPRAPRAGRRRRSKTRRGGVVVARRAPAGRAAASRAQREREERGARHHVEDRAHRQELDVPPARELGAALGVAERDLAEAERRKADAADSTATVAPARRRTGARAARHAESATDTPGRRPRSTATRLSVDISSKSARIAPSGSVRSRAREARGDRVAAHREPRAVDVDRRVVRAEHRAESPAVPQHQLDLAEGVDERHFGASSIGSCAWCLRVSKCVGPCACLHTSAEADGRDPALHVLNTKIMRVLALALLAPAAAFAPSGRMSARAAARTRPCGWRPSRSAATRSRTVVPTLITPARRERRARAGGGQVVHGAGHPRGLRDVEGLRQAPERRDEEARGPAREVSAGTPPYLAIEQRLTQTKTRFKTYADSGLLCGKDGLPHLVTSATRRTRPSSSSPRLLPVHGGLDRLGGRKYLQVNAKTANPTMGEIIFDVPTALKIMSSGLRGRTTPIRSSSPATLSRAPRRSRSRRAGGPPPPERFRRGPPSTAPPAATPGRERERDAARIRARRGTRRAFRARARGGARFCRGLPSGYPRGNVWPRFSSSRLGSRVCRPIALGCSALGGCVRRWRHSSRRRVRRRFLWGPRARGAIRSPSNRTSDCRAKTRVAMAHQSRLSSPSLLCVQNRRGADGRGLGGGEGRDTPRRAEPGRRRRPNTSR